MGFLGFLWLAASIEGQLTNALTGAPVRKADVAIGTMDGVVAQRVLSDANGRFKATGLAAGRYRVAAARAGYLPTLSSAAIVLKRDDRREVNIAMQTPAVIAGRVLDEESDPVEGILVAALMRDEVKGAIRLAAVSKTNDWGEYRFGGLNAGTYAIRASRLAAPLGEMYQPAYYPAAEEWDGALPVRVAAGGEARELDISVRKSKPGTIVGAVRGGEGGVEPVRLRISRRSADAVMLTVTEGELTASPEGLFRFADAPPGAYVLTAEVNRRTGELLWASAEVNVSSGIEAQAELMLRPAGVLAVESNAPVRAVLTRGDRYRSEARVARGELLFENVMPGTWWPRVEAISPDSFVESVQWRGQETLGRPFEIPAGARPALRIQVNGKGGTVEGEGEGAMLIPEGGGTAIDAVESKNGRYRVRGVRPGKYRLSCSGEVIEVAVGAVLNRDCPP